MPPGSCICHWGRIRHNVRLGTWEDSFRVTLVSTISRTTQSKLGGVGGRETERKQWGAWGKREESLAWLGGQEREDNEAWLVGSPITTGQHWWPDELSTLMYIVGGLTVAVVPVHVLMNPVIHRSWFCAIYKAQPILLIKASGCLQAASNMLNGNSTSTMTSYYVAYILMNLVCSKS